MSVPTPLYIPSKGRWETRHTSKVLTWMNVRHHIVVEEQEAEAYRDACSGLCTVLVLDPQYQRDYEVCDDLGDTKSKGPGAARNFAWDHAIDLGAKWHWVMDDNIRDFYYLNDNEKLRVGDGALFTYMEAFTRRYLNVVMAGPQYDMFIPRKQADQYPPFAMNTRIYSCNLIRNNAPFRWRGRYNEDTDLSLRMLKAGYCTIQYNAFMQGKINTQQVKGGNTAEFYGKEGTRPKSQMQVDLHPDVSRLVWKFGRWHHHVDYSGFKKRNKMVRRRGSMPDAEFQFVPLVKG